MKNISKDLSKEISNGEINQSGKNMHFDSTTDDKIMSKMTNESTNSQLNKRSDNFNSMKNTTVCIRKKPASNDNDIIGVSGNSILIKNNKVSYAVNYSPSNHCFTFDTIFDYKSSNLDIFNCTVKNLVNFSLNGGSSSVIAYGQTGSGKTHTLLEGENSMVFESIAYGLTKVSQGSISFLEIYFNNVQDCLNGQKKIDIFEKDNQILAHGITEMRFKTVEEAKDILKKGLSVRITSKTDMNDRSSRSHAIISVRFNNIYDKYEDSLFLSNTLLFVDLAGSEKGTDRKSCSKEAASEGAEINKSLLALKECIRGIEKGQKFLPFRQSKLTQILKNILVGNTKRLFIATISPYEKDVDQTLNTLRYADRLKDMNYVKPKGSDETFAQSVKESPLSDKNKSSSEILATTQNSSDTKGGLGNLNDKEDLNDADLFDKSDIVYFQSNESDIFNKNLHDLLEEAGDFGVTISSNRNLEKNNNQQLNLNNKYYNDRNTEEANTKEIIEMPKKIYDNSHHTEEKNKQRGIYTFKEEKKEICETLADLKLESEEIKNSLPSHIVSNYESHYYAKVLANNNLTTYSNKCDNLIINKNLLNDKISNKKHTVKEIETDMDVLSDESEDSYCGFFCGTKVLNKLLSKKPIHPAIQVEESNRHKLPCIISNSNTTPKDKESDIMSPYSKEKQDTLNHKSNINNQLHTANYSHNSTLDSSSKNTVKDTEIFSTKNISATENYKIRPLTISLEKSKIKNLLDQLKEKIDSEKNIQKLKRVYSSLDELLGYFK